MSFRKHKNEYFDDLVHKIELSDLETGEPAMLKGKRQFIVVKGSKSSAFKNAVEDIENAKRKKKGDEDFDLERLGRQLAKRISYITVAAYIDASAGDKEDIIDFEDIAELSKIERDNVRHQLISLLSDVSDLAIEINTEVEKESNFLISKGQTLSKLYSSELGTTPKSKEASQAPSPDDE